MDASRVGVECVCVCVLCDIGLSRRASGERRAERGPMPGLSGFIASSKLLEMDMSQPCSMGWQSHKLDDAKYFAATTEQMI